jgi:hypothetical protein
MIYPLSYFMLRYVFLAAFGLIATTGLLSAQTAPTESPPAAAPAAAEPANSVEAMEDPQTGDHWTYEVRDDITGDVKSTVTNTVTDVSDKEISVRVAVLGKPNFGYLTYDRLWNLTNSGIWRYTPNDGSGIRPPLPIGKTWSVRGSDLNSTAGVGWKRSVTSKVIARESVTTRAGTFETFKIETSIQLQNAQDPTRKFQEVLQTWYAPAIDHWVKRSSVQRSGGQVRNKDTTELVEYGRL